MKKRKLQMSFNVSVVIADQDTVIASNECFQNKLIRRDFSPHFVVVPDIVSVNSLTAFLQAPNQRTFCTVSTDEFGLHRVIVG